MILLFITLLPHLFWMAENEIEQYYGDPHDFWSKVLLVNIILMFFFLGPTFNLPWYGVEYLVVRLIFFAPYWSLRRYGHIYYLGGGQWNEIERWVGDDVRMWLRFLLLMVYIWYILCRFAVL